MLILLVVSVLVMIALAIHHPAYAGMLLFAIMSGVLFYAAYKTEEKK